MFHASNGPRWQQQGAPYVWMPYTQMQTAPLPIAVVATEPFHLVLDDGRRLLDGQASWWTACHGYNHPALVRAIERQLTTLPHVMFGGIHHPPALCLAERLATLLPGDLQHVFFCDSGSVAVEIALKMAFQYWRNRGETGRHQFVAFRHAYHGDTRGAMSVCDPINSMHSHFAGYLQPAICRDLPSSPDACRLLDATLASQRSQIAAVIVEPLVQGAGGMKFHSAETLVALRQICDRYDLLLIADEIATGFGRTGTMFACEQAAIVPDIICLGKALTGGMLTMAATVANQRVYEAFLGDDPMLALMHGPTYMANPLACAAALASLELFQNEPRVEQARGMESILEDGLSPCRGMPGVIDVRCRGAIGVIEFDRLDKLESLRRQIVEAGIWLRPFNNMVYLTPALNMPSELVRELCERVVQVIGAR